MKKKLLSFALAALMLMSVPTFATAQGTSLQPKMVGEVESVSVNGFSARTLDGTATISSSVLAENNITLMTLWGDSCEYSASQLATMQTVSASYSQLSVGFMSVLVEGTPETAAQITADAGITFPCVVVDTVIAGALYGELLGYPTTFVVDSNSNVLQKIGGEMESEYMTTIIRAWLNELGFEYDLPGEETEPDVLTPEPSTNGICGFDTTDIYGNPVSGSILQQYHMTAIMTWADWCGYCKAQMPAMQQIYEDFAIYGVTCMGIAGSNTTMASAQSIASQYGITFINLMPDDVLNSRILNSVSGWPTTFFITQDGSTHARQGGQMSYAALRANFRTYLRSNGLPYQSSDIGTLITPEEVTFEMGDANNDGIINVGDCSTILRYALNLVELDASQFTCADVNGDTLVNTGDAAYLLELIMNQH